VPNTPSDDYGGLAHDSKRNQMLMFTGSRRKGAGGVWSCDLKPGVVEKLEVENLPAGPTQPRECIYLPDGDFVLFAATKDKAAIIYDVAAKKFRCLEIKKPLGPKPHSYGLMYDFKRKLVWVVGCGGGWPVRVMRFDPKTAVYLDK